MNLTDERPFSNEKTFERVAYSSEIYPIEYIPNFHELEYAIPGRERQGGLAANSQADADHAYELHLSGGRSFCRRRFGHVEPLLPARQRDGLRLRQPGRSTIGAISSTSMRSCRQYGARPHWGKLHFNRAEDMPSLYPRFHDFQAIRRRMDPSGRFLNDHLRNLFV